MRPFALASFVAIGLAWAPPTAAEDLPFVIVADRDDDDIDGKSDCEQDRLGPSALTDARPLDPRLEGAMVKPEKGAEDLFRVVAEGGVWPGGKPLPRTAYLQGRRPGKGALLVHTKEGVDERLNVAVIGVAFRGGDGRDLDLTKNRASLEREPPEAAPTANATYADPDALRAVLRVPRGTPVPAISIESVAAPDLRLDVLSQVSLEEVPCATDRVEGVRGPKPLSASGTQGGSSAAKETSARDSSDRCLATEPLRFVVDDTDRSHPVVAKRSLRAEVGGAIVVRSGERVLQTLRVEGPRSSPVGAIPRLRATLRALVVRLSAGGSPAIGGTDAAAVALLRSELALASATWGQCGVTFGPARSIDVKVVDPPPPYLVSFGNDLGLPATGGDVRLRVDGKVVAMKLEAKASADQAAREFAVMLTKSGYKPTLSPNARIGPGAEGSVDVLVRRKNGALATVELDRAAASNDATMVVRIGRVDLSDGLQHFGDMDSMAGTLEERTLLKAFDDGDPTTLEIFVVPAFASGGRIGESFIASDLSSLRNVVILDRAGLRARRSSLTLAHELGHVLLNMPGHPDDFGVDTPTLLMDSDAADASAFGPRRLSLEDCARVVRESGPQARTPLLKPWPLDPMGK